ncbi:MAG TPA: type II toxin-antitoxin system HicB family antitoxin [Candidatus Bilamarchaeum sp.]|nr:type II toxin-antitoxin system HicB family antitoxin [Candidatus Bilamarchaeum sp.]
MKSITVEGYEVEITRVDDKFVVSVPKLPGCIVQVDKESDARGEIRKMIGLYLQGVAGKSPGVAPQKRKV